MAGTFGQRDVIKRLSVNLKLEKCKDQKYASVRFKANPNLRVIIIKLSET